LARHKFYTGTDQIRQPAYILDLTADRYFGESQPLAAIGRASDRLDWVPGKNQFDLGRDSAYEQSMQYFINILSDRKSLISKGCEWWSGIYEKHSSEDSLGM
jgi:hypothetical protein